MFDAPLRRFAVTACCVAMLAACGSSNPGPSPAPSSAAVQSSVTPTASWPPDERALQIVERLIQLDIKHLYGGDPVLPKEFHQFMAPHVVQWFEEDYAEVRTGNYSFEGIEQATNEVALFKGEVPEKTIAAVHSCSNFEKVTVLKDGVPQGTGGVIYARYFFGLIDGSLMIVDMTGEMVTECTLQ